MSSRRLLGIACGKLFDFLFFAFGFFSLASANSYRSASVAPVRGGTYFSLQRQRKVGKRKPPLYLRCLPE